MRDRKHALIGLAALGAASVAFGQVTSEVEPNEAKVTATTVSAPLAPGHTLTGTTTGSSTTTPGIASADYFKVQTAGEALGIYRHRLVLTSATAGHTVSIRGVGQVGVAQAPWLPNQAIGTPNTTDSAVQTGTTTTTPARMVQWYGFGLAESLYYRVTGTTSTTAPYTATYEREPVTATDVGSFNAGTIIIKTFGEGHTSDTDLWIYDGGLNAITGWGNDDEAAAAISGVPGALGTTLQSAISRDYPPGTYYLAISNYNLVNSSPSPSDDDYRTGTLLDLPGAILNSATTANVNISFSISDGKNTVPVAATKVGPFDVNFYRFTVGGADTCPADFDDDGVVGASDLARILGAWGTKDPAFDLAGDGGPVGASDLSVMLGAWGDCP